MKKYLNYCLRCSIGINSDKNYCLQCKNELCNGFSAFNAYKDDGLLLSMISVVYEMENYRQGRLDKRLRFSKG